MKKKIFMIVAIACMAFSAPMSALADGEPEQNAFSLLCGGDPSMEIWTGVQNNFNQPSFFISGGNITISVENADNFNVNIVSADGMLLGKYNSQNESTITIPLPNVDCDIALDKHNYIPYVIHFGTQYIQNETITGDAIYTGYPHQSDMMSQLQKNLEM